MACENGDSVRKKIISNLLSSGIEKFFIIGVQFISSIILIRLLPREDYGIIGIVMGYFAFINIVNISLESIILRDHKKFDDNLHEVMQSFFMFNLLKSILFILIAFALSILLSNICENSGFIYAIWSITFITISDAITAPFVIYFSSKFNQKLVTKISILRYTLGLIILLGLYYYPELWFVAVKDFIISILFIGFWILTSFKHFNFIPKVKSQDIVFIKEAFFSYSLWTHLNGVVTNFIYRSDTFFLSFFVSLILVGNYTVALNSANIANVLPMIVGYQNSIALSNAKDENQIYTISNHFILLSLVIGVATIIGFYLVGDFYLYLVTGKEENDEIFFYMMCIVTGLVIVKSFASPLVSYITIFQSVKKMVIFISLPIFITTVIMYYLGAKLYGVEGIALSNIFVSIVWLSVIILFLENNTRNLFMKLVWNKS
ncbi:MAG TPA: hypothetical protein EYG89_06350 [Bacteroidia bacterium]|nr:hypothetical protein [Bacteroidia bacterium]